MAIGVVVRKLALIDIMIILKAIKKECKVIDEAFDVAFVTCCHNNASDEQIQVVAREGEELKITCIVGYKH